MSLFSIFKRNQRSEPKPKEQPKQPRRISARFLAGKKRSRLTTDKPHESLFLATTEFILPPESSLEEWRRQNLDDLTLSRLSVAELTELIADISPEVNRAVWDFIRFCNPGWEIKAVVGDDESAAGNVALDEMIKILNGLYGSVDVVFNQLFMSAFLRGALLAEVVLDGEGRRFVDFVTPDPHIIRFKRIFHPERGAIWQLGQHQAGGFVRLDVLTVSYIPVDPFPGKPYGRPMITAAIFTGIFLIGLLHDIRRVISQQGYPRLDLVIDLEKLLESMPAGLDDDPDEFKQWVDDITDEVINVYSNLEPDDAYVHTDVVNVNNPVGTLGGGASGLTAIDEIIRMLERMSVRALKSMPFLMGLSETTTETQANRQWESHTATIKSIQHLAETLIENLFGVALRAQGIQADVVFRFAELRASELFRDAQTETVQINNASAKYDKGWISQDQASEEVTGSMADVPAPRVTMSSSVGAIDTIDVEAGEERINELFIDYLNAFKQNGQQKNTKR